ARARREHPVRQPPAERPERLIANDACLQDLDCWLAPLLLGDRTELGRVDHPEQRPGRAVGAEPMIATGRDDRPRPGRALDSRPSAPAPPADPRPPPRGERAGGGGGGMSIAAGRPETGDQGPPPPPPRRKGRGYHGRPRLGGPRERTAPESG